MRRLIVVLTVLVGFNSVPVRSEPAVGSGYRGHSLIYALEDLQDKGLRVLYSSDLVDPEMMVEREPTASSLHRILDQLLGPHGLGT